MIEQVLQQLEHYYKDKPAPIVDLLEIQGASPFKLLVATLLSARTQDQVTARAVQKLFAKIKNCNGLQKLPVKDVEQLIYPVGFFRTKARHLHDLANKLARTGGQVPSNREELMQLPGVGRKTANLVLSVAFGQATICVDTHVHRISNRLGWVHTKEPSETELALEKILPRKCYGKINRLFVTHGQTLCRPLSPRCTECPIRKDCTYAKNLPSK